MSRKVYSEIYLHVVWRAKDSRPLIEVEMEEALYNFIKHKCAEAPGVFCHCIGGTDDHLHLCVSVPPSALISDLIGELKGASSHFINKKDGKKALQWQTGYGVVSFGKNNLDFVMDYIERQKEHHGSGKIHGRLERVEADEE
ncbi:MAG: IS200/IS605 family transposase [Deltaproteobacteria bacterium]|nr:IS200/IS605 family transposase [Deltaproteobacteria bacterium]